MREAGRDAQLSQLRGGRRRSRRGVVGIAAKAAVGGGLASEIAAVEIRQPKTAAPRRRLYDHDRSHGPPKPGGTNARAAVARPPGGVG